jgi:hypothetical protein
MTTKKYYWDINSEMCLTCMFIDEYALNVNDNGETPYGYDGTAECCLFNWDENETFDNRWYVSPLWKPCPKYKKCTERQAGYLDIFDIETQTIIPNPNDISKINNE